MKLKELIDSFESDPEFIILAGGPVFDGRPICRVDKHILKACTDFDWLMEKEVAMTEARSPWQAIEVTINLTERTDD